MELTPLPTLLESMTRNWIHPSWVVLNIFIFNLRITWKFTQFSPWFHEILNFPNREAGCWEGSQIPFSNIFLWCFISSFGLFPLISWQKSRSEWRWMSLLMAKGSEFRGLWGPFQWFGLLQTWPWTLPGTGHCQSMKEFFHRISQHSQMYPKTWFPPHGRFSYSKIASAFPLFQHWASSDSARSHPTHLGEFSMELWRLEKTFKILGPIFQAPSLIQFLTMIPEFIEIVKLLGGGTIRGNI